MNQSFYVLALVVEASGQVRVMSFHDTPGEEIGRPAPDGLCAIGTPGPLRPCPAAVAAAMELYAREHRVPAITREEKP